MYCVWVKWEIVIITVVLYWLTVISLLFTVG